MSDSVGRFVALTAPDAVELGAKFWNNQTKPPPSGAHRRPRSNLPPSVPPLGKKDLTVNTGSSAPADLQSALDRHLGAYVDSFADPLQKAAALIKIGNYSQELARYQSVLTKADPEVAEEAITAWIAAGDGELKKMLYNAITGSEELTLAKGQTDDSADMVLTKRLDALPDDRARMRTIQHIGTYTNQLGMLLSKAASLQMPDEEVESLIKAWIDNGDRSHAELKGEIVQLDREARLQKKAGAIYGDGVGMKEAQLVDDTAGNAASHTGSKLGATGVNEPHKSVPNRSNGEGAGSRLRGAMTPPGMRSRGTPMPGSGPTDTGDGGASVEASVTRAGTTGGLGSVDIDDHPMTEGNDSQIDPKTGKRRKKVMDKGADLALELTKIIPDAMVVALSKCAPEVQIEVMKEAAQHGADLMAWSAEEPVDQMQKAALSAAVSQWLSADPESLALKKWTAEALGSAEEIPLSLARAIMAWAPPAAPRLRAQYA